MTKIKCLPTVPIIKCMNIEHDTIVTTGYMFNN